MFFEQLLSFLSVGQVTVQVIKVNRRVKFIEVLVRHFDMIGRSS